MITRYRVFIDGIPLDGVSDKIIIRDIVESAPTMDLITLDNAGRAGMHVDRNKRKSLAVQIGFEIHERDIANRQAIVDSVNGWAKGHILTTNARPGQRLNVICTTAAAVRSALRWTDEINMTFSAFDAPYWEDDHLTEVNGTGGGTARTATILLTGTEKTPLEAEVTAVATFGSLSVTCNGQTIQFRDLALKVGDVVRIGHDEHGYMTLTVKSGNDVRSVFNRRTPESVDEIWLEPGQNVITTSSGANCNLKVMARGRWI